MKIFATTYEGRVHKYYLKYSSAFEELEAEVTRLPEIKFKWKGAKLLYLHETISSPLPTWYVWGEVIEINVEEL